LPTRTAAEARIICFCRRLTARDAAKRRLKRARCALSVCAAAPPPAMPRPSRCRRAAQHSVASRAFTSSPLPVLAAFRRRADFDPSRRRRHQPVTRSPPQRYRSARRMLIFMPHASFASAFLAFSRQAFSPAVTPDAAAMLLTRCFAILPPALRFTRHAPEKRKGSAERC